MSDFYTHTGARLPIIGGPMYPCSNLELVAAVSKAGGIGIVQPVSMTFVHKQDFREGLRAIRQITDAPIGMNALIEKSSKRYHEKMVSWVDIALEEGVRFFITSLGNPAWVVKRVEEVGGVVYHDVTERKWALKGLDAGAKGLIAVNNRAGGHAGSLSQEALYAELKDLGVPLVCAGGIGDEMAFTQALGLGYAACQLGTRFIASEECNSSLVYKKAILAADEKDVVLSEKITGVPVSVIRTPYIERMGIQAGPIARWLLQGNRTKHWMRLFYTLRSAFRLRDASVNPPEEEATRQQEFWQAGKSVAGINKIEPVAQIMGRFEATLERELNKGRK